MKQFKVYDDTDLDDEIWPKSRPLVKARVIFAALVCVFFVLSVVGVVVWLNGRV